MRIALNGVVTPDGVLVQQPDQPAFDGAYLRNHGGLPVGAPVIVEIAAERLAGTAANESIVTSYGVRPR